MTPPTLPPLSLSPSASLSVIPLPSVSICIYLPLRLSICLSTSLSLYHPSICLPLSFSLEIKGSNSSCIEPSWRATQLSSSSDLGGEAQKKILCDISPSRQKSHQHMPPPHTHNKLLHPRRIPVLEETREK